MISGAGSSAWAVHSPQSPKAPLEDSLEQAELVWLGTYLHTTRQTHLEILAIHAFNNRNDPFIAITEAGTWPNHAAH